MVRKRARLNRPDDQLLTTTEVAEIFGVTPSTVVKWADKGLRPAFRTVGGHRRYRASDLDKFRLGAQDSEPPQPG
jgi:excisionase family DNA binding protein